MIAYKAFKIAKAKLYPFWVSSDFEHYPKYLIHLRSDECGPFACFKKVEQAKCFTGWHDDIKSVIYKINIKKSKERGLWIGGSGSYYNRRGHKFIPDWDGTIYADEFEILERIK